MALRKNKKGLIIWRPRKLAGGLFLEKNCEMEYKKLKKGKVSEIINSKLELDLFLKRESLKLITNKRGKDGIVNWR